MVMKARPAAVILTSGTLKPIMRCRLVIFSIHAGKYLPQPVKIDVQRLIIQLGRLWPGTDPVSIH
jgi:hypothetical protein